MPIQRPRILHASQMAGTGVVSPSNLNALAQSSSGNKNLIINGAMNVSQRGTSQAFAHDGTTNAFLIDRWRFVMNSTDELDGTYAQVDDDPLGGDGKALKWTTGTAESAIASDEYGYFTQKIEAQNLQHIQNGNSNAKSLTLSFYVKSSITGTFSVGLYKPDNTARQHNKTYTINSANTWEKKSVTFAGDTSGGGINNDNGEGIWVSWNLFAGSDWKGGGSTSGWTDYANNKWADGLATDAVMTTAGATWLMTQCQLEIGQNSTEFEHEPFDVTFRKCQRYLEIWSDVDSFNASPASGYSNLYKAWLPFHTQKRTDPTVSTYGIGGYPNNAGYTDTDGVGNDAVSYSRISKHGFYIGGVASPYSFQCAMSADAEL